MIEVEDRGGGVYLPEAGFWLDPRRRKGRAFVSHAHSDHFAEHAEALCSAPTAALVAVRYPRKRARRLETPGWRQPVHLADGFIGELWPAGHVLGSSMLRVVREKDGASLLYTGDFKLRPGLAAEPPEFPRADVLVMESTFGRPQFTFPDERETGRAVVGFARSTVARGGVAVFLAYSLGKAQEALAILASGAPEVPVMAHPAVAAVTGVYRSELPGVHFPELVPFDPSPAGAAGHVVIYPPRGAQLAELREVPGCRVAVLTGWAVDPRAKYRYRADEAIPLSDHAGFDDLLRAVELVRPQVVFTVHGYDREFAASLRSRGWRAWSLAGGDQVELDLGIPL